MAPSNDAAILAALQERVAGHESWLREIAADTKATREILYQARGGMAVLRWIAGGSLAAFIGLLALLYQISSRSPAPH